MTLKIQQVCVIFCIFNVFNALTLKNSIPKHFTKFGRRIIEGTHVDNQKYPFIAGLVQFTSLGPEYFCGACIISEYWIISAEHCFALHIELNRLTEDNLRVVSNNNIWKNGTFHSVNKWVRHEPIQVDFDIALFKVNEPFNGPFEKPIPIAEDGYILRPRTTVKVLGWGAVAGETIISNNELQGTSLKLYTDTQCRKIFNAFAQAYGVQTITPLMFCAGPARVEDKKDSCSIDSGGPIIDDDILVGIVSWGAQSQERQVYCGVGYPGVYVRLWKFEKWIHQIEEKEGEHIAKFKHEPNWLNKNYVG